MNTHELESLLDRIEADTGRGTWRVSYYIRPEKSIQQARNEIRAEVSEAESIKSDETRDRVQSALGRIDRALQKYENTPPNGIAVFASHENTYVIDDPPFPISENRYRCDNEFETGLLRAGNESGIRVVLVVIERGRASIGIYRNETVSDITTMESMVMGKTQAGGFSQQRYERIREEQKHEFYKKVCDRVVEIGRQHDTDLVVTGGTLSSADSFEDYLPHDMENLGTFPVDHADESGLGELVSRAGDVIMEEQRADMRDAVSRFLNGISTDMSSYGRDEVEQAIEYGAVDTLLLSTTIDQDDIDYFSERVTDTGGTVIMVSPDFEEGQMFDNLGGIGAILRFKIV